MFVKICGIKTVDAAKIAVLAGADCIGFIFAKSSRTILPDTAAAIVKELPTSIKKVGVFANQSVSDIRKIASIVGLDYVQLHGKESAEFANQISLPVIKAVSIESKEDLVQLETYPADYFLLDLPKKPKSTEKPKTLNWKELASLSLPLEKIILAGGLIAENVAEAIAIVQPFGVDVASGVETAGEKDELKVRAFIQRAKTISRK